MKHTITFFATLALLVAIMVGCSTQHSVVTVFVPDTLTNHVIVVVNVRQNMTDPTEVSVPFNSNNVPIYATP